MSKRCSNCGAGLRFGQEQCLSCGSNVGENGQATTARVYHCHFSEDNKCRGKVNVRVNDLWICQRHYELGYDRKLKAGQIVPQVDMIVQRNQQIVLEELEKLAKDNPTLTTREVCLKFLKREGLLSVLPAQLQADPEAQAERAAIQAEGEAA